MSKWSKLLRGAQNSTVRGTRKPSGWYRRLGRPLSAVEVEAQLGIVVPCRGYMIAELKGEGIASSLRGWWQQRHGDSKSAFRAPYLDAVWDLAVKRRLREIKRNGGKL